jgi:hypothetical protein
LRRFGEAGTVVTPPATYQFNCRRTSLTAELPLLFEGSINGGTATLVSARVTPMNTLSMTAFSFKGQHSIAMSA